jgi:hypothetical protein
MIEFGLIAFLLLATLVVGLIVLAVVIVVAVLRLGFNLISFVLRTLTWPVRRAFSPRHTAESGHPCPRPGCKQPNPDFARFCSRCGRALTTSYNPAPTVPPPIHSATPSWSAR